MSFIWKGFQDWLGHLVAEIYIWPTFDFVNKSTGLEMLELCNIIERETSKAQNYFVERFVMSKTCSLCVLLCVRLDICMASYIGTQNVKIEPFFRMTCIKSTNISTKWWTVLGKKRTSFSSQTNWRGRRQKVRESWLPVLDFDKVLMKIINLLMRYAIKIVSRIDIYRLSCNLEFWPYRIYIYI